VTRRELALLLPLLAVYVLAVFFFPAHPDDEGSYIALAERLTHGTYVTGDQGALLDANPMSPDLWFGPGLPAVLAPLVALDAPTSVLRSTGALFLFGAVLLLYVLARDRWGARVALVSAYGVGLYLPFLTLLPNLHSEAPAIFFTAAAMLAVSRHLNRGSRLSFAAAAAALAALALTRVAYGWVLTAMLLALAVWWLFGRSKVAARSTLIVAAALVLCVPWLAYTHEKTGRLFVWGNSGALSFYWMTSPYAGDLGDWQKGDEVFTNPALALHRPFFESLRGLTLADQNARIEHQALHNVAHHPGKYVENVAANVSRMLFNSPYSRTQEQTNDLYYALPDALVVGAVVLCLLVLIPRRRRLPPETGPFVVLAGTAFTLHALLAAYPRMLMPIVPVIAWLTTLALVEVGVLGSEPTIDARAGTPAPTGSA
jgi:4-amino-4-deoxy-L-arabinose transferase-like glycosyltransferase